MSTTCSIIHERLSRVYERIKKACLHVGRSEKEVTLLLATKTVSARQLAEAADGGEVIFGENRVQEGALKAKQLGDMNANIYDRVNWHLIGHLQTNKAKHAVNVFNCIHSIDRIRLVDKIKRILQVCGKSLDVYVQVNASGEASKYGVAPKEAVSLVEEVQAADSIKLRGLMTLGRLGASPESSRPAFRLLRKLRDRMIAEGVIDNNQGGLSMGMSNDFEVAIEEGASLVRIGSAVFGQRKVEDSVYWP